MNNGHTFQAIRWRCLDCGIESSRPNLTFGDPCQGAHEAGKKMAQDSMAAAFGKGADSERGG